MNKIIAIVGMCGSGKSIASDYYEEKGFEKIYFGGVTLDKLKEQNLEITPENEKMMREKLRSEYGMGAFALLLLDKIEEAQKNNNVVLAEFSISAISLSSAFLKLRALIFLFSNLS